MSRLSPEDTSRDQTTGLAEVDSALDRALDLNGSQRQTYLDSLELDVRRKVIELLEASEKGGPLDAPLGDVAAHLLEIAGGDLDGAAEAFEGRLIGHWRLLERLGAGGMGVVYLAERVSEDFEQRAALKVIRWELADSLMVRRFLAERKILAQLSHPHIAALIDGGVTDGGLPFLVLEYVEGHAIDVYCEHEGLDRRRRLELIVAVARAVDFAHRQLVVHRDLKPSNILVRRDGVPKLVDFGVARLLDDSGAEATRLAPITPHYAAPEQRRGEAVSVASDVWSLGVVAAELLAGERPGSAGIESLRPWLEAQGVRGDLADILLRATDEEAEHRYRSAGELADDLERWLAGRPVEATPPRAGYRLRKWLRRHLAATVVGTIIGLLGLTGVVWQGLEARAERDRARLEAERAEQISDFLLALFRSAAPRVGEEPSVRSMLDRGAEQIRGELLEAPEKRAEVLTSLGEAYKWLHEFDKAKELLEEARDLFARHRAGSVRHAVSVAAVGSVELLRGHGPEGEREFLRALDLIDETDEEAVGSRASILNSLGMARHQDGDSQAAIEHLEHSAQLFAAVEDALGLAMARGNLGLAYDNVGRFTEGEKEHREAARLYRQNDPLNTTIAAVLNNLANNLAAQGRLDEALVTIEQTLEVRRAVSVPGPGLAEAEANLAFLLISSGRSTEAVDLARRASEALEKSKPGSRNAIATRANLGWALALEARYDESLPILRQVLVELEQRFGADHRITARGRTRLGAAALRAGELESAMEQLSAAVDHYRRGAVEGGALADALLPFGVLACEQGRGAQALADFEVALEIYTELGPGWLRELAYLEKARCLHKLGREWSAEHTQDALKRLREHRGAETWGVRRAEEFLSLKRSFSGT